MSPPARERIATAGPGGGYILSTACSVAPLAPPENILTLREAAERFGRYPLAEGLPAEPYPGAAREEHK